MHQSKSVMRLLCGVLVAATTACTSAPSAAPTTALVPGAAKPAAAASPATAASPVAAAKPVDDAVVAAAKSEGSAVLYGSPRIEALQADADAFQKRYGISVVPTTLSGAVVTTRIDAELGGGNVAADVIFSPDEIALVKWTDAGALAKLPDGELKKTTDYYAPMQVIGQGVVYNTTLAPAANLPRTWADVLDPKWKGQILLGTPRMSSAYSQTYAALLDDPKYGQAFFEKLATQEPRIINTLAPMIQSIAAGEAALGFIGFPQDVVNLKQTAPTAPIEFAYLDVTTNAVTNVAIMAQAKHPNAARLFAQWMMSTEGQTVHNGNGRASSQLGALPGTLPPPPVAALRPITSVDSAKQAPRLFALFDSLFK